MQVSGIFHARDSCGKKWLEGSQGPEEPSSPKEWCICWELDAAVSEMFFCNQGEVLVKSILFETDLTSRNLKSHSFVESLPVFERVANVFAVLGYVMMPSKWP